MFQEYEEYTKTYTEKYGESTVVLYQNGGFYEIFGVDNEEEKIGCAREATEVLNIQLSRRNASKLENNRNNPLFAGFKVEHVNRFMSILLENGYTVVVVDQITSPPKPKRGVTGVYSPSTSTIGSNRLENYLCGVLAMETYGLVALELSIGRIYLFETGDFSDINRFLLRFEPSEVVMFGDFDYEQVAIPQGANVIKQELDRDMLKCSLQNHFLNKIYREYNFGVLSPLEYFGLERTPCAGAVLILALQFALDHNVKLADRLESPVVWHPDHQLVLEDTALSQLDICRKGDSVLKQYDNCRTAMGRRLLRARLTAPSCQTEILQSRYDNIEELTSCYESYRKILRYIGDLERLHRKACLGSLTPNELYNLDHSYDTVQRVVNLDRDHEVQGAHGARGAEGVEGSLKRLLFYREELDLEALAKSSLEYASGNFFREGVSPELDQLDRDLNSWFSFLDQFKQKVSNLIRKNTDDLVKREYMSNERYYRFRVTRTRARNGGLEGAYIDCGDGEKTQLKMQNCGKNDYQIVCSKLDEANREIARVERELRSGLQERYRQLLTQLADLKEDNMVVANYVAERDVSSNLAHIGDKYRYYLPRLAKKGVKREEEGEEDGAEEKPFLKLRNLRHPLIERLIEGSYVSHDIDLKESRRGILLYGVNSSGKSSTMKAVGIVTVCAQAGFPVPADMTFLPYRRVATRILSNDNLFRGLSSYAVEMTELRNILRKADPWTLILGDEVCHGTDTDSATAMVGASLITMHERESHFIFATHLHQLSKMKEVTELPCLKQYHLKVEHCRDRDLLIYDRKLYDGPGPSVYGIEVAQAMKIPLETIRIANRLREKYCPDGDDLTLSRVSTSRYNRDSVKDECKVCGEQATDTHHIKFRKEADSKGYIGNLPVNSRYNLVSLCADCHHHVHHSDSSGKTLVIRRNKAGEIDWQWVDCMESLQESNLRKVIGKIISPKEKPVGTHH